MEKQLIWVFEWRKSVHYWWSYILFSPECKELTSMLDPLLYRWGVPPVVIRCVHWTMQMGVLLAWIMAQSTAIVMMIQKNLWRYISFLYNMLYFPEVAVKRSKYIKNTIHCYVLYGSRIVSLYQDMYCIVAMPYHFTPIDLLELSTQCLSRIFFLHFFRMTHLLWAFRKNNLDFIYSIYM